MDDWVFLGLAAAVLYAFSAIAAKIATSSKYYHIEPRVAVLLTAVGILIAAIVYYIATGSHEFNGSILSVITALSVGVFWAAGTILVFIALGKGASVSRLNPIYNMNTLITVVLGIVLLKEIPDKSESLRVLAGAVFIVVGGILVLG